MNELPVPLYTAEQTRLLDKTAINEAGIPGFTLMKRAAKSAFSVLMQRWPHARSITVLCGAGNNGGDGFVMATLAVQRGWTVQARYVGDAMFAQQLRGEAFEAWQWACAEGVEFLPFDADEPLRGEVVVDAMLGTGLNGTVKPSFIAAIKRVNKSNKPVLAVDIPSGLSADTGSVLGEAVRASVTVTFIGLKLGLLMHEAVDYVGELVFESLRLPDSVYESVNVSAFRLSDEDIEACLPRRKRSAHKGDFGHLLVIGGDHGMGGAAIMAAEAAVNAGAGKVTLATRPEHVTAALMRCPEVMVQGINSGQELVPLLDKVDAVVFGPGLGLGAWAEQMLQALWNSSLPCVVDADGLTLLKRTGKLYEVDRANWVITPHPGEASRLLSMPTAQVQQDRLSSAQRLHEQTGATVVLKGAGTLVTDGDVMHLCAAGNPGMASGGMGDVLSGVIGALVAQKLSTIDAARIGVYAHAAAADRCAAATGERGLKATDLPPYVKLILNHR